MREVLLAFGVAAIGKLEAGLIDRVYKVVDAPVRVGACVVGGVVVAFDNLDILVAVVPLLLGEADGGVNLVADAVEVGGISARGVDKRGGADGGCLLCVVVAVVDEYVAAERAAGLHLAGGRCVADIHVLAAAEVAGVVAVTVEINQIDDTLAYLGRTEAGAIGHGACGTAQQEAGAVGHLQLVAAVGAAVLILVGVGRSLLRHLHRPGVFVGREVQFAAYGGEVLALIGCQPHRAVEHLLVVGLIATLDGERRLVGAAVVAGFDGPRSFGPCLLPRCQCRNCQHRAEDFV